MNPRYFEIFKKVHIQLFLLLLLSQQHFLVFSEMVVSSLRILKQKEHEHLPINLQLSENTSPFRCNLFRVSNKNEAPDQATISFTLLSDTLTHFDPKLNRIKNVF